MIQLATPQQREPARETELAPLLSTMHTNMGHASSGGSSLSVSWSTMRLCVYYLLLYFFTVVYNIANKRVLNVLPLPATMAVVQLFLGIPLFLPLWIAKPPSHFSSLSPAAVMKVSVAHALGNLATIYSLGNPHDLGMILVPGTYNGLQKYSFYPRIHFTGAVNAGMSGGPTVDAAGKVVGVNVASAGNQLGFLVPADALQALLQRFLQDGEVADFKQQ